MRTLEMRLCVCVCVPRLFHTHTHACSRVINQAIELKERLVEECCVDGSSAGDRSPREAMVFKNKSGSSERRQLGGTSQGAKGAGVVQGGVSNPPELDVMDVEEMATVTELQAALQKRGLSVEVSPWCQ